jgi:hypothetical protein
MQFKLWVGSEEKKKKEIYDVGDKVACPPAGLSGKWAILLSCKKR